MVRGAIHERCRTYETLKKICTSLDIDLDRSLEEAGLSNDGEGQASINHGAYSRDLYRHLIGHYTTIQPLYEKPHFIRRYRTLIEWDDEISALRFVEEYPDGEKGHLYIPPSSAFLYLMTVRHGYVRTVLVSQILDKETTMRGLVLCQFRSSGNNFMPVCSPIAYIKQQLGAAALSYAEIGIGNSDHESYDRLLKETVSNGFAKMITFADGVLSTVVQKPKRARP